MRTYAKIEDKERNLVSVAIGTNATFYSSIGMVEMDVEQSNIDGNWYVKGYAPMKSTEQEYSEARITELQAYLTSTDWYAIRYADTGEFIPEDVKIKRAEARAEISKLRGDA